MLHRQTPRVVLRRARQGRFEDLEVLVIEMGLGGAKFEHPSRLDLDRVASFSCGPLTTQAVVRHSVLLPTPTGLIHQSGVAFTALGPAENDLLFELLVREARQQVVEWESNLAGQPPVRPAGGPVTRSAVAQRFISLKLLASGWDRSITTDPNQPLNGVTILDATPENEIAMLRHTYQTGDDAARELLRRIATVAILERLRG